MIDFYQIIYEPGQQKECYAFAKVYLNVGVTDFFENSVITDLVPKSQAEFIAVCSWRLRKKRLDGWTPMLCGFAGKPDDLSEEKIMQQNADVMVLTPRTPGHQMLANAAKWHGGPQHNYAWEKAYKVLSEFIPAPIEVKTAIYENHFIARKSIYHEYVSDCLLPVLDFMRANPVFYQDSGYAEKKERDPQGGIQAVERYRKETGRHDWPIAPFILERLFSIWINDKQLKIVNV